MMKQWTAKTLASETETSAINIKKMKYATIRLFQGKKGKYYTTTEGGLLYDSHFPVEWALSHYDLTGPEECGNCKAYGSLNGVFVHYCACCAPKYAVSSRVYSRGGIIENISDATEEQLWREFPYMTGVYFSEIGNDPVKQLPRGIRYAELTVIINKKCPEDMCYLLNGTHRYPIRMPFKDLVLFSRLPPAAQMTDTPFVCGSDFHVKQIYLYQGQLGQYYTVGEVARPLYDIHFPVEWALNHKSNAKGYGSGPSSCGMCAYHGSINKVFVRYCDECLLIYGGERGEQMESPMTEEELWRKFPYMSGVGFHEIGDKIESHDEED